MVVTRRQSLSNATKQAQEAKVQVVEAAKDEFFGVKRKHTSEISHYDDADKTSEDDEEDEDEAPSDHEEDPADNEEDEPSDNVELDFGVLDDDEQLALVALGVFELPAPATAQEPDPDSIVPGSVYTFRQFVRVRELLPEIRYSYRYLCAGWEYRHVILPRDLYMNFIPMRFKNMLLSESEWRQCGLQMSPGWQHYELCAPEPWVWLFRHRLAKPGDEEDESEEDQDDENESEEDGHDDEEQADTEEDEDEDAEMDE